MRAIVIAALAAGLAIAAAGAATAAGPFGVWATEKKEDGRYLHVRIHPCKDAPGEVCGTIEKALAGANTANEGKPIVWGMKPAGENYWKQGSIWKVDEDKVYRSKMELLDESHLKVSGCILGGLICKSQVWERVGD